MRRETHTVFIRASLIDGAEKMTEQEELHDEDVIVVISDEEGVEHYYREEMIVPLGTERFAVLVALHMDADGALEDSDDEDEATIAKIIVDESGEDIYTDPTDEEFEAVCRAYERLAEQEEE